LSSKFNLSPLSILRPSICKKPHGSCWPAWPPDRPLFLHAYMELWDLDPLDPIGATGYTQMPMIDPAPIYDGTSPPAANRLRARLERAVLPNHWNLACTLYPPTPTPGFWVWTDIYVDPAKPFDTGLVRRLILPGLDYQKVRIMQ